MSMKRKKSYISPEFTLFSCTTAFICAASDTMKIEDKEDGSAEVDVNPDKTPGHGGASGAQAKEHWYDFNDCWSEN